MGESTTERNIATIRRFYESGPADDDAERHPFAAPDIVWHVPGANHVAADYRGTTDVFERMPALMQPLDEWTMEVQAIMANRDLVTAFVHLRGARGEKRVDCLGGHVFRLDDDGRIVEAWGFVEDQAGLDALLDA